MVCIPYGSIYTCPDSAAFVLCQLSWAGTPFLKSWLCCVPLALATRGLLCTIWKPMQPQPALHVLRVSVGQSTVTAMGQQLDLQLQRLLLRFSFNFSASQTSMGSSATESPGFSGGHLHRSSKWDSSSSWGFYLILDLHIRLPECWPLTTGSASDVKATALQRLLNQNLQSGNSKPV